MSIPGCDGLHNNRWAAASVHHQVQIIPLISSLPGPFKHFWTEQRHLQAFPNLKRPQTWRKSWKYLVQTAGVTLCLPTPPNSTVHWENRTLRGLSPGPGSSLAAAAAAWDGAALAPTSPGISFLLGWEMSGMIGGLRGLTCNFFDLFWMVGIAR